MTGRPGSWLTEVPTYWLDGRLIDFVAERKQNSDGSTLSPSRHTDNALIAITTSRAKQANNGTHVPKQTYGLQAQHVSNDTNKT